MLTTDTSGSGWGAVFGEDRTNGRWGLEEKDEHVNVLEMKAVLFGLKSFCKEVRDVQIKCEVDNTIAVAYINHQRGTRSKDCDCVAFDIDLFASRLTYVQNWLLGFLTLMPFLLMPFLGTGVIGRFMLSPHTASS